MKSIIKSLSITFVLIIIMSLFLHLLTNFNLINNYIYRILLVIIISIIIFINSLLLGKKEKEKAYITGLKYGGITIAFMFLISVLLFRNISSYMIIYYFIILLVSITGSVIGINMKKS